jgi:NAD(P)H-nitrite reductase large subunit
MKQFIIIGNSAAGIAAVESIRKYDKDSKVTVFSNEDYSAYCRCLISYYLAGDIKEDKILYRPQDFYKNNNVELCLNKRASRVDLKKCRVILEDKTQHSYDALLIATGASPKFPETKGIKKNGVYGFRTIKDVKEISGLLPVTRSACVMGGGLVGLKAAYGLKKRGVDVKVIIRSKQVLSQMLDYDAAGFVQRKLEENGIEVITGQDVSEIIGEGDIRAVKIDSGKAFEATMIIVGKGVSPNTDMVKGSEIKINEGIAVDSAMRTSIPNIYAAGDVSESYDVSLGRNAVNALWPVAVEGGKAAGANMAGAAVSYDGSVGMNSIEFFGLPVVSLGLYKVKEQDGSFEELKICDTRENIYKKVILKDGLMVGAVLVGNINNSGVFLRIIRERIDTSSFKDRLLDNNFGYPDIMDLVKDKEKLYV